MVQTRTRRCDDRIVSISQPYARAMVRGKQNKPVEFGAKFSVSLDGDGFARVDHLRWDAFHEGLDLKSQVEAYFERTGDYLERVIADPQYGTRENRFFFFWLVLISPLCKCRHRYLGVLALNAA